MARAKAFSREDIAAMSDEDLRDAYHEWRRTTWRYSQMRNASGVFRAQRIVDALFAEKKRRGL